MQNTSTADFDSLFPWTERIWKQLNQTSQPAHSVLFFGRNGLGKTHVALQYAKNILAADEVFLSANHPDFHVLLPADETQAILEKNDLKEGEPIKDSCSHEVLLSVYAQRYIEKSAAKAKRIISVQQIRSLIRQVNQHPQLAEKKVIIIKSADKMNINASNALLKTLEEPPSNTIFILLANQIEKLPITIRSRCAEFHFKAPDKEFGLQWLAQNGLETHIESYLMMAGRAPLAAQSLATENEIEKLRGIFSSINMLWAQKVSSIDLAAEWKKHGFVAIIRHLNQFLQDLLKLKLLGSSSNDIADITEFFYPVQSEWIKKIGQTVQMEQLFKTIEEIQSIQKLGESPVDQQLLLEKTAIELEKLALSKVNLV